MIVAVIFVHYISNLVVAGSNISVFRHLLVESVTAIKDFGIQLQLKYFFGSEELLVIKNTILL